MKRDIVGQTIQFNDKNYTVSRCDKRYDHGIALQTCNTNRFSI